ncbi:MAG: DUF554 domain-containing protein [Trueperaceae bacterium]|nr:DUF554 domain-containing protein [Trueperaceae bacterium]
MSPFEQTSGTLVNTLSVLVGSGLGLWLRHRLPRRTVRVMMQAIGLTTLFIGLNAAFDLTRVDAPPGVIVALLGLALGGALGEAMRIEDGLEAIGDLLKRRFAGEGRFTEGFVTATLLFCVGPLTLLGSIQNGLTGDPSFLLLKSTLDGLSALALATTFGLGVMMSAAVVLVFQGGLSLAAGTLTTLVPDPTADPRVLLVNGVGGLMIVGLGLGLLDLVKVRVASMLPALLLAVPLWWLLGPLF